MWRNLLFAAFVISTLSACQSSRSTLVEDQQFTLVRASSGDTFESLSLQHFGDINAKDLIKRVNPNSEAPLAGQMIAIPKSNLFPGGIFSDKYMTVPVLCYHQFTSQRSEEKAMVLHVDDFEQQMQYLVDEGYSVISLNALASFLKGNSPIPEKSVVITIDDGFKSFYKYALPILERYQFASTVFIYPEFVGGRLSLTWDQIKRLEKHPLIDIESHSLTHDNLKRKSNEDEAHYSARLQREVVVPQTSFERRLNKKTYFYAYPFGDTSTELMTLLQEQNYKLGLTVERGTNASYTPPYLVKRNMVFGGRDFSEFLKHLQFNRKLN